MDDDLLFRLKVSGPLQGTRQDAIDEIERLTEENKRLRSAGRDLCLAIDNVICWYSSGFAPAAQELAYNKAQKAKDAFNAIQQQTNKRS